ncbi:uncharacterized protein LOC127705600 [Mytilus californianus]|uniref:uncharacterized protein LOC127705600 n=1 Tax=Mytilus californianus TaxID=6549 RepID=UPI00224542A8|nr:uncharacterized protein LOC127705600 [Mytilus californianus]
MTYNYQKSITSLVMDICYDLFLDGKQSSRKLATDVLQITFLGYTGFRFPIAHFQTDGVKASELYIIIWYLISQLQSLGFIVDFIMQDGGRQNREFTKLHFTDTADKMRNHLAEKVLNEDMLQLMKSYQNSLINGDVLNSAIDLLQQTSKLITALRHPQNIFCQQWGLYNGNSTNPNYHVYCNTMNSVILGQTTKSRARKSNAGLPTNDPYSFHVNVPLSKKKKVLCRI